MNFHLILDLFLDVLRNALLITGLVVVMMMMIEYINVLSSGKWFARLQSSKPRQVLLGSILGLIPGCMGGFAAVSLYSHGLISFGALVATMICSSGDESFVMLAMIPRQALILFAILFVLSIGCGLLVDYLFKDKKSIQVSCDQQFEVHSEDREHHTLPSIFKGSSYRNLLHPSKERIILIIGITLFIVAIFTGFLEHEHGAEAHDNIKNINVFSERWLNIVFACLSVITLLFTITAEDHFIREHIWDHVIKKHCLSIFLWTFGALAVIEAGLQYVDISQWIKDNTFYIIILAALIGLIPESGPHLLFVTMFASGIVPFSVLLSSSISQDGHTALPLLASNKIAFVRAKLLNAAFAIIFGSVAMLCGV